MTLPQLPDNVLLLRVFISYSRQDKLFVDAMYANLAACGATPHPGLSLTHIWYDQRPSLPARNGKKC